MSDVLTVVVAVLSSGAVAALVAQRAERRQAVWGIKRDACLSALDIVTARFSHVEWVTNAQPAPVLRQDRPSIEAIRRCHNDLSITCRRAEVVHEYLRCLGVNATAAESADALDDLRNAVRKELRFYWRRLPADRTKTFIATVKQAAEARDTRGDE